ncbi:DedA family protein [candidate division WWE3 bacterium]|jgi:membrane-associated protein|nr:DedA family protein [candidate division WWE3 bacterium]MBT7349433.1 DedA family protein [candidate division WWE3 bacterium]
MNAAVDAFLNHDLIGLIEAVGMFGVWGMVFAESGLLIGFFLPGDSLMFTAGFLASPAVGLFNVQTLLIGAWIAAILGDNVGYAFGKRVGPKLFRRPDSFLFKQENIIKAEEFYEKHGGKAIVLARFMPIVRTFTPIVAGIGKMDYKKFLFFNFLGGTLWIFGLGYLGFFLGSLIPDIDKYLLPIVLGIIVLSILPPIMHFYKESNETPKDHAVMAFKKVAYFVRSFLPTKEE